MLHMASRYVAVSTSVVAQKLLSEPSPEAPRARPCRVSSADRSVRKGIMTHSLEDLRLKVGMGLPLHSPLWGPWLRAGPNSCLCIMSQGLSRGGVHGLDGEKISFLMALQWACSAHLESCLSVDRGRAVHYCLILTIGQWYFWSLFFLLEGPLGSLFQWYLNL